MRFYGCVFKRKEYSSFVQSDLQLPPNYFGLVSGCVAQFVEWSLQIPEVHGSNPVIGKNIFILNICLMSTVYWKDKNKEKEAGIGHLKKLHKVRRNNYISCSINWPFTNNNEICPKDIFAKTGSYLHTLIRQVPYPPFSDHFLFNYWFFFSIQHQTAKCLTKWLTN